MKIKIILPPVFVLAGLLLSCTQKNEAAGSAQYLQSSTTIFGVGYNSDTAESDLNSVFYAYRQGVIYHFTGEGLKLKLDYSSRKGLLTVEDLTNASLKKLADNFYIYELPYTASIYIQGGSWKRFSTAFSTDKPVSYLSKMLARAIIEELGKSHKKNQSGYVYIMSLKYGPASGNGLLINADLLLTETENK